MYYILASDKTKLAVEDINKDSRKTIVLVHGWPISKEMFEYQKDVLNDSGYRVISYDIRGFGSSEASSNNYNYDQLADDLKTVIDGLNTDNVNLLGFSMGGAICVHYMAKFNNYKVSKLILAGAAVPSFVRNIQNPYGKTREELDSLINDVYTDRPKAVSNFGKDVFALNHGVEFNDWFKWLCFKASGIGTIKTAISLRDENVFEDLKKINVPTLILHGRLDKVCPYNFTEIMTKEIKNSRLIAFDYSGHGLFYDEKYKFNNELIKFIGEG